MKKSYILIGGSVVGILAYLYFKNKKSSENSSIIENTDITSTNLPDNTKASNTVGTSSVVSSPVDVVQKTNVITEKDLFDKIDANSLSVQIKNAIAKKNSYKKKKSRDGYQRIIIDPLLKKIASLGYVALPDGTAERI